MIIMMRSLATPALLVLHLRVHLSGEARLIAGIQELKIHFLLHLGGVAPSGNPTRCSKNMMKK